jgi:hypothetical protein
VDVKDTPVVGLTCCCCGDSTRGRQWWNRDTGFGICAACIRWLRKRGESAKEIHDCYGVEGVHFNVEDSTQ